MKLTRQVVTTEYDEFFGAMLWTGIFGIFGVFGGLNSNFRGNGAAALNAAKWKGIGIGILGHLCVFGCGLLISWLLSFLISDRTVFLLLGFGLSAALWVALVLSAKNGALISLFKRLSPSSKKGEPAYVKPTPASPPKPAAEPAPAPVLEQAPEQSAQPEPEQAEAPVRETPEPEHVEAPVRETPEPERDTEAPEAPEIPEAAADERRSLREVAEQMRQLLEKGDASSAKALGDPVIGSVLAEKAEKIDGHTLPSSDLERLMHAALLGKNEEKPDAEDDYTGFLLAYAAALQNSTTVENGKERFLTPESAQFLSIAAELSPENADVWRLLARAARARGDEASYLDCMKKALLFATAKTGPCSLAEAYEDLGCYYAIKDELSLASALLDAVRACGGDGLAIRFLLSKRQAPPGDEAFQSVLKRHGIQWGFSSLVTASAQFLCGPGAAGLTDERARAAAAEILTPFS